MQPVSEPVPAPEPLNETETPAAVDGDLRRLLQDLFDQQRVILQRELRDTYTDLAARFANESRPAPPVELADAEPEVQPAEKSSPWLVALLVALIVFAVIVFWQEQQLRTLKQTNEAMSVASQGTDTPPSANGNESMRWSGVSTSQRLTTGTRFPSANAAWSCLTNCWRALCQLVLLVRLRSTFTLVISAWWTMAAGCSSWHRTTCQRPTAIR